ncbi:MAG: hypothetical protein JSS42_08550 [Proteobacteria bacterium]|nr:hypothetical protein [Pseudomonadota bacterium]
MLSGKIQLTLMVGPVVPVPAPRVVMEALNEVSVTSSDEGRSGFQLSFALSTSSPLHTLFLLGSGMSAIPVIRVVIVATVSGTPHVIMDGAMTKFEIKPGTKSAQAILTVFGEDLSVFMDQTDFSGLPFPAMPAEGRVALLLAKYAVLGVVPLVIPSVMVDVPLPTSKIEAQKGTDLVYINQLAERVGYVFYIEPGPLPGQSIGYWGPQIKVGVPQPALSINMDGHSNVESLDFSFKNDKHELPAYYYYNEQSKLILEVPLPPITPLSPPLGLIPPIPTALTPVADNLSKLPVPQGIMRGLAAAAKWVEVVEGDGTLDVVRYGRLLKSRQLVGVRGAGLAYDGLHYVKSVTHTIKRGEYKQSFKLSRNGLISTVPRVAA